VFIAATLLVVIVVFFSLLCSIAKQVCEQEPPQTSAT
jgi:hypothetical protein